MDAHRARERNGLFALLSVMTLGATLLLLGLRSHLLVPRWVLVAIGVPWIAFSVFLRAHRDTWGREGKLLDLWSIPHAMGGVLLGVFDIGGVWVLALAIWWELVESVSRIFEHATNRVTDVVIAMAGWALAQLVVTGVLRLV